MTIHAAITRLTLAVGKPRARELVTKFCATLTARELVALGVVLDLEERAAAEGPVTP